MNLLREQIDLSRKTVAPVQRPRNKIGSFAFGCHNWKEMYIEFIVETPSELIMYSLDMTLISCVGLSYIDSLHSLKMATRVDSTWVRGFTSSVI